MSAPIARPEPPRLALNVQESCAALGISADTFTTHVLPGVRTVRLGRRILIPTTELQTWLDQHAEAVQ